MNWKKLSAILLALAALGCRVEYKKDQPSIYKINCVGTANISWDVESYSRPSPYRVGNGLIKFYDAKYHNKRWWWEDEIYIPVGHAFSIKRANK